MATSTVQIRNVSSYGLYGIQLAPWDEPSWGGDVLRGDPLLPGEAAEIDVFACARYDLRVIDDEGEECIIQDLDLCFQDEVWTVDDVLLAACSIFGA